MKEFEVIETSEKKRETRSEHRDKGTHQNVIPPTPFPHEMQDPDSVLKPSEKLR